MDDGVANARLATESLLKRTLECSDDRLPHTFLYQRVKASLGTKASFWELVEELNTMVIDPQLLSTALNRVLLGIPEFNVNFLVRNHDVARRIISQNKLGSIVMVTPEIAPWSKIGGVAVMVDALVQDLAAMGLEIHVISPYYNRNRDGKTDYLKDDGILFDSLIDTHIGPTPVRVGLHYTFRNKVHYYFLHHADHFPYPYAADYPMQQLNGVILLAKASLEVLCQKKILPMMIVSHDWPAGLLAPYVKMGYFGSSFRGATTFHVIHNLEEGYQGRIWPEEYRGTCNYIHQLPDDIIWDPVARCLDTSRAALRIADQWATVSTSYRNDLLASSPYNYLLRRFSRPFAYSNGIRVALRRAQMSQIAPSHDVAKEKALRKYFGINVTNPADVRSYVLMSFVGRITEQKGVHLIIQAIHHIMYKYPQKVLILIGGQATWSDKYGSHWASAMRELRYKFPQQFWCDPDAFFGDGPLLNLATDFGLMPSLFEPGGQVQQEYFAAGTPVIAYSTGGLKDTVVEFDVDQERGNGFLFLAHRWEDLAYAVDRSLKVYFDEKDTYERLRENAARSVLDSVHVSRQWGKEFARLRGCMWVQDVIQELALLDQEQREKEKGEQAQVQTQAQSLVMPLLTTKE
jgi:starch synthase